MKSSNIRLLRTPRPYPDENLKGLILRATEENSYERSSQLLSLAEARVDTKTGLTLYTEERFNKLSRMLNLDVPTLRELACLTGIEEKPPQAYNMFGHRISIYSVRVNAPKICPGCLQENNYVRKIWDLAAFTCCPKHKTMLIEECPKCGSKISWSRNKVSECICGQDWREVPLTEVSEKETNLSELILSKCGLRKDAGPAVGRIGNDGTGSRAINPLSNVGLRELLSAAYFIAGQQNGVVDATGKQFACRLPHEDLHKALVKAVAVFESWPDNFFKLIEESRGKHSKGASQTGLYKDFGKLYDPLFIRKNNYLPDFMRHAFKEYVTTFWDGGYAGRYETFSREDLSKKTYLTKQETAKYLCVAIHTVDILHKKGYLKGPYFPWVNRSRVMIEADSARELKSKWDKSLTASQAGKSLDIGRIAVVGLVKKGCLEAIKGPSVTGQLEWKFEVSALDSLLQVLEDKIDRIPVKAAETVDFHMAIKKLSNIGMQTGQFVKLILDGKIAPPISKGPGTGLASLIFDSGEIEQFLKSTLTNRRGDKRTMKEAVKLLGSSNTELAFLVKRGLIVAEKSSSADRSPWVITQAEIDRFDSTYCTVGLLTDALGTSTRGLAQRLMKNCIMPVTGPAIDGGSLYYFRKADLETVDVNKLLPEKKTNIQKMNHRGLVSQRQLADITGYPIDRIKLIIKESWIFPTLLLRSEDGRISKPYFSQDQIDKFKAIKAVEDNQLVLFDIRRVAIKSKAALFYRLPFVQTMAERITEKTTVREHQLKLFKFGQEALRAAA